VELVKRVKKFIKKEWDGKSPLLLGYSGGPDSKALLYSLLEAKIPLHLAHVDHGWREESAMQAQELAAEAERLGCPFHAHRLKGKPSRNAEDAARGERLSFFQSLYERIPFQALLLAHHQDDVAETALKRVLEGAHLSHLGGMAEVSTMNGLPVWRPLLTVRKKELLSYLQQRSLVPIHDHTNEDKAFLRARFRQEMLPMLSRGLGKEIHENLSLLSTRAFELKNYLEKKVAVHWAARVETEGKLEVSLQGLERLEARYVVQKAIASQGLLLSRNVLESLLDSLGSRAKDFSIGGAALRLDGFILRLRKLTCINEI
jgi:tRNA(Ile)-lysidine synthase